MNTDLLLTNGRVHTMDPAVPVAQALAIRGERVLAVGPFERVEALAPDAHVLDLQGRTVVPGFVDAHIHFLSFARSLRQLKLDGLAAPRAVAERVSERAASTPTGEWIEGRWERNVVAEGGFNVRELLDQAAPHHPVVLSSKDSHAVWVNSRALERAGIGPDLPDPPGGRVVRDEDGSPNGVLLEAAQQLVWAGADQPSRTELLSTLVAGVKLAQSLGITAIHDLEDATALWCFQRLEAEGALGLRVFMGLPLASLEAAEQVGLQTGFGGPRLRIGLVKLFADGALGSLTAHMLEPYETDPDNLGIAVMQAGELDQAIGRARRAGLGVAVHAIGDAANRAVLDAVERVNARDLRHGQIVRIEHAQCVSPQDLPRFARLGVVASVQPVHATSDMELAERHWGARSAHAYAWRSLLEAGAQLAFGSDAPVESPDPLKSLYAAVARRRPDGVPAGGWYPEHRLTLQQAVRAYTVGSAAAAGLGAVQGSLSPGKFADLLVLSHPIFDLEPEALLETRVEMTVFGGRVVFGG